MLIHVAREGREIGQFTTEELQSRLTERTIKPTDYAWTEGMDSWQLIHEVFKIEWPRHQQDSAITAATAQERQNASKPKFLYGTSPRR